MGDDNFHIGRAIKGELERQERSIAWLARKIGCDASSLSRHLKKQYIEMDIVVRSSVALGHNFGEEFLKHIKERMEDEE